MGHQPNSRELGVFGGKLVDTKPAFKPLEGKLDLPAQTVRI